MTLVMICWKIVIIILSYYVHMVETIGILLQRAYSLKEDDPEGALSLYEKILEIEPETMVALVKKAECLGELGRYEEQLKCLDKIIEYRNEFYDLYNNQISRIEEEEKISSFYFTEIILDAEINIGYIYGLKTGTLFQLDRYEEALECNLQFMMHRKVDHLLYDHLEIQDRISDTEYIQKLKAILEFFPNHYPTLNRLARMYYRLGDYQNSLKYHTKILETHPDSLDHHEAIDLIKKKI